MARPPALMAEDELAAALARLDGGEATRADLKSLTKHYLGVRVRRAPGRSGAVRVPPFAAVQCIEGSTHTRGTPPAVVETDAETWIALARGRLAWVDASVRASGSRSDLSTWLPLDER